MVKQHVVLRTTQYCYKFAKREYYGYWISFWVKQVIENLTEFASFYEISSGQNEFFFKFLLRQKLKIR